MAMELDQFTVSQGTVPEQNLVVGYLVAMELDQFTFSQETVPVQHLVVRYLVTYFFFVTADNF